MNDYVSEESRYLGTGINNFRARLYDSVLMRFYQVDPAEQQASPYTYCADNPIMMIDPDGCNNHYSGAGNQYILTR